MTAAAQPQIELRPLQKEQRPIAWLWIEAVWDFLADDYFPKDIDAYFEIRERQGAIQLGVYVEGEFGGVVTLIPRLPCTVEGHTVFKKRFQRRLVIVPAFEAAIRFCWSAGYQKITCLAFPDNRSMINILEELGAIKEGVLLHETQRKGEPADIASFALLKS